MTYHPRSPSSEASSEDDGVVDFLDDDCGHNALRLATRGNAIIANLLSLATHIPVEFVSPNTSPYAGLLFDFAYFQQQESLEKHIAESAELLALDKELYDTHIELLKNFMSLFRSIYGYAMELNRYICEIQEGQYVAQTVDSVLESQTGQQLLCELYHLYGVMLLLLDLKVSGCVRERIIVSYIRYVGSGEAHTVEVAELCRATSYNPAGCGVERATASSNPQPSSGPALYPVDFFARLPIQRGVIGRLLACIRSKDLYSMSRCYPDPEHRSAAMAHQGALAFVLLFFCGDVLVAQRQVMQELVEKHFADSWVVHYYGGFTADLTVAWAAFPAARATLRVILDAQRVSFHVQRMRSSLLRSTERIQSILQEGVRTESYILDKVQSLLLPIITEANVVLRWFVLHGVCTAASSASSSPSTTAPSATPPALADVELQELNAAATAAVQSIHASFDNESLLTLLLATAQLENHVQSSFFTLLQEKSARWTSAKQQAVSRVEKLSHFFSEDNILDASVQDAELQRWFSEVAQRISNLNLKRRSGNSTRRKLQRLVAALENLQEFDQINQQLQVLQYVRETCSELHQMLHYMNAERHILTRLRTVTDMSFAWDSVARRGYLVPELQARIRRHPVVAAQMCALFVKLSSLLHRPTFRIEQGITVGATSHSGVDPRLERAMTFTTVFYSEEVVSFLRKVLQVIPTSIFEVLHKVMYLLTNSLRDYPSKLLREEWKQWSQLETREQLSTYTADIARYAAGLLAMEETVLGAVRIKPHSLLEDGIRKELVEHITRELHVGIWFDRANPSTIDDLDKELAQLATRLRGVRNSFEYIQDFVNVHGLKIWLEEFQRIVRFTLQMECNSLLRKKVYPWSSPYQSVNIVIPYFGAAEPKDAYSFLGRLVQHLLFLTDPRESIYLTAHGAWFTRRRLRECVGPRLLARVAEAIDDVGLACLDELLCYITVNDLQMIVRRFAEASTSLATTHDELVQIVWTRCTPTNATPEREAFMKDYDRLAAALDAAISGKELSEILMRVGRMTLIRQLIAHQLRLDSRLDCSALAACAETVNNSIKTLLEGHLSEYLWGPQPVGEARGCAEVPETLLCNSSTILRSVGLTNPFATVYETQESVMGSTIDIVGGAPLSKSLSQEKFSFSTSPNSNRAASSSAALPASMPLPLFVLPLVALLLLNVQHVAYSEKFDGCIPATKDDDIDPSVLAVGVSCLLQQFPLEATELLFRLLAQVVRVSVNPLLPLSRTKDTAGTSSLVERCADVLPIWVGVLRCYLPRGCKNYDTYLLPCSVLARHTPI